jgi:cation diffusion facilitator CzcD-associated flavoprotein CzcO
VRSTVGKTDVDAIVIGAGFSGLYMLHRLRDLLGMSVRLFEAGSGVGGTWHWNRYPGARSDSEGYVYCYSFDKALLQEWEWSGKYPQQPEILSYLNHVADRFELRPNIQLNTRVLSAHFDDDSQTWAIETDSGERLSARFLITGIGLLASAPYTPTLPGIADFAGDWYHTGTWPHDGVDLAGKRVAVIGTGSTGVQAAATIAHEVDHLYVVQRTPQYTIPARHELFDRAFVQDVKANYDEIWEKARWSAGGFPWQHNGLSALEVPAEERQQTFERLWEEGGFKFVFGSYKDILTDREANDFAADFVRNKIAERVDDPAIAEKLIPRDHPFGSRRPIIDTNYFEIFNQDNVTLIDTRTEPLEEITRTSLRTAAEQYEVDVIIFATGFDAVTGPFLRMDIRGEDGLTLQEKWRGGPRTYLGLATAGFPNMFMVTGPGSTFGNLTVSIEHHVEWISDCLEYMAEQGIDVMSADPDAEAAWGAQIARDAERTLAAQADSWWTGANIPGKPRGVLFYPGSFGRYRKICDEVAADGYRGFVARRRTAA